MSSFQAPIALQGFVLGAGLIMAIGAQNAFVLRQGLKRAAPLLTALTCATCDAILIAAGLLGAGALVNAHPALANWAAGLGAAFLFWYGARSLRAALQPGQLQAAEGQGVVQWQKVIVTTLGFSLLNPHVYLDTVVLLGSIGSQFPAGAARVSFGFGAIMASFVWFFCLAYGAAKLAPLFAKPAAWRVLDVLIGLTMWGIAATLAARILA
ncbi:LysE/ArgO family amino acid transporter [Chitinimonas viridis]|uniref:LysE/ArgO family amino acid transporter n=2 Tax=Chitinimonas TaxID=240411 RepID=A0ABT8B479_9NEIS|nr:MULTISPECIES: LysE/ArgO family amino acid transporter [Chitinimonas]MDN3577059.1 LysE/ArgO family amino acid transporter [Chitinimonas viridis]GLR13576.1 amino acid transporter [Chitinimonas prasina]